MEDFQFKPVSKKGRGKNQTWKAYAPPMCTNAQLAEWKTSNKFESNWGSLRKNRLKSGGGAVSETFYCRLAHSCKAQMRIDVFNQDDDFEAKIMVMNNQTPHDHSSEAVLPKAPYVPLPQPVKVATNTCLDLEQTLKQAKDYMFSKNIDTSEVTDRKLNNYMYQERMRRQDDTNQAKVLTTSDLRLLAEQNKPEAAAYGEAAVFGLEIDETVQPPYFFLFVTSQKLLDAQVNFGNLHLDTTWKTMYSGFPFFIPFFTDNNGRTWEIGAVMSSGEGNRTFGHIIRCCMRLPKAVGPYSVKEHTIDAEGKEVVVHVYTPDMIMADAADAISIAQEREVPGALRAMCYPHVDRAWSKKADELGIKQDSVQRKVIEEQVAQLQLARSFLEFQSACDCLLREWHAQPEVAMQLLSTYFGAQWGPSTRYFGWFEGFDPRRPSSQNGPESKHRWFKKNVLRNTRRNTALMFQKCKTAVNNWGKELDDNIMESPSLTKVVELSHETDAWQFLNGPNRKKWLQFNFSPEVTLFLVVPESCADEYPEDITVCEATLRSYAWPTLPFSTFAEYVKCRFSVWVVTWKKCAPTTDGCWTCTCYEWVKSKLCKHELALKVIHGLYQLRPEASQIPLGCKRKAGRPKRMPINQALVRDPLSVPEPTLTTNYLAMQLMQPPEVHVSPVSFDCPVAITHADFEEAQPDHFTFMNNDA